FTIRIEYEARILIKGRSVYMIADGSCGDDFAGIRVHHRHHLTSTADEYPTVRPVHCHTGRGFARRQRPMLIDGELARIDFHQFALVFEIIKNVSIPISHRKLGPATKLEGASYFAIRR